MATGPYRTPPTAIPGTTSSCADPGVRLAADVGPQSRRLQRRSERQPRGSANPPSAPTAWIRGVAALLRPRCSRRVVPSYSVRRAPRSCSRGTTSSTNSSRGPGCGTRMKPSHASDCTSGIDLGGHLLRAVRRRLTAVLDRAPRRRRRRSRLSGSASVPTGSPSRRETGDRCSGCARRPRRCAVRRARRRGGKHLELVRIPTVRHRPRLDVGVVPLPVGSAECGRQQHVGVPGAEVPAVRRVTDLHTIGWPCGPLAGLRRRCTSKCAPSWSTARMRHRVRRRHRVWSSAVTASACPAVP